MERFVVNILDLKSEFTLIFAVMIPLLGVMFSLVIKKNRIRNITILIISITSFLAVKSLFYTAVRTGGFPPFVLTEPIEGLAIKFFIDPLGGMFALIASFLWIVTTIYSIGYMNANKEVNQGRFHAFFSLAIFAAMGIALSANLFTMFIFYEILTLSTFPLVTHHRTEKAKKSGRIYLGFLLGTSLAFFLPAIIITNYIAGNNEFTIGGILADKADPLMTAVLLALFIFGIGKAALMPFHRWLPAAMVAPTPVSALLHAVAVVKAGVFAIIKIIIYIFGTSNLTKLSFENWWVAEWLPYVSLFTIIASSMIALKQDNLKLRLAYSTIAQLAYIVFAVSLFSAMGLIAAIFHIAAHAAGKISLFFAAGSIHTVTHRKNISELAGMGRAMPFTMAVFTIGAISMIGLPPMAGFITKYHILRGIFDSVVYTFNQQLLFAGMIIISSLLNAAYYLPVIISAYFREGSGELKRKEAPAPILIAMGITAFVTIALFIYPNFFLWVGASSALGR